MIPDRNYLVSMKGPCPIFLHLSESQEIDFGFDTTFVSQTIRSTYRRFHEVNEYEITVSSHDFGWHYVVDNPPLIFNMMDSIIKYSNVDEQYDKLDDFLYNY